jgi:hypothetical protein
MGLTLGFDNTVLLTVLYLFDEAVGFNRLGCAIYAT